MPPRLFSLAIVLFWMTMTGWLLYREVWPQFRPGEAPPYNIDLTEEVGANMVQWSMYDGKSAVDDEGNKRDAVAVGHSQVVRLPDRTFELRSQFRFNQAVMHIPVFGKDQGINLKKLTGSYHVTDSGELLSLGSGFVVGETTPKGAIIDYEVEIRGQVHNHILVLDKMLLGGHEQPIPDWAKAEIAVRGPVFNPMQLLNRVPGLRSGQRWRLPLLEPLGGQLSHLSALLQRSLAMPELEATVSTGMLHWNEMDVPCHIIAYARPGEEDVHARTWVRRRDGLVLQQQAGIAGRGFTIVRVPPKL
jgi:hypothetical protein